MSIETVVARASCRETEKRFTTMAFFFRFLRAIVAWENGDDGKCSPQWNDLGHFAELN